MGGEKNDALLLGAVLDFSTSGRVRISMKGYVEDKLDEYEVEGCASTPATDRLFEISEGSPTLNKAQREEYHSRVAKLLYLAKRVRPDILTAVACLSTRVQSPTEQDNEKLARVLRYVNGTKDMSICLEEKNGVTTLAYVDASFGVHEGYKSHTGAALSIGRGSIYVRSSKETLVAELSTEAVLIGVSDLLPQVIWNRDSVPGQKVYDRISEQRFFYKREDLAYHNKVLLCQG